MSYCAPLTTVTACSINNLRGTFFLPTITKIHNYKITIVSNVNIFPLCPQNLLRCNLLSSLKCVHTKSQTQLLCYHEYQRSLPETLHRSEAR